MKKVKRTSKVEPSWAIETYMFDQGGQWMTWDLDSEHNSWWSMIRRVAKIWNRDGKEGFRVLHHRVRDRGFTLQMTVHTFRYKGTSGV